jgi:hypothetical protein
MSSSDVIAGLIGAFVVASLLVAIFVVYPV